MDGVHVGNGVYVASVAVGVGVSVVGNKTDETSFIEQDCNKIAIANTKWNLRISNLFKVIIPWTRTYPDFTTCPPLAYPAIDPQK